MQLVGRGFLGWAVGVAAWMVAQRFVAFYELDSQERSGSSAARGLLSSPALAVQAGMALLGGYLAWRVSSLAGFVPPLVVTGLLLAISLVDLAVRRIPNGLVLGLLVWALVQALWLGEPTVQGGALGLLVGGGLFLLISLVGRGTTGAGDVKLAAALGAVLGYPLVWRGLFCGILAGGVAALLLLAARRAGRKDYMAYGPCLALGAWLAWTQSFGLWP